MSSVWVSASYFLICYVSVMPFLCLRYAASPKGNHLVTAQVFTASGVMLEHATTSFKAFASYIFPDVWPFIAEAGEIPVGVGPVKAGASPSGKWKFGVQLNTAVEHHGTINIRFTDAWDLSSITAPLYHIETIAPVDNKAVSMVAGNKYISMRINTPGASLLPSLVTIYMEAVRIKIPVAPMSYTISFDTMAADGVLLDKGSVNVMAVTNRISAEPLPSVVVGSSPSRDWDFPLRTVAPLIGGGDFKFFFSDAWDLALLAADMTEQFEAVSVTASVMVTRGGRGLQRPI